MIKKIFFALVIASTASLVFANPLSQKSQSADVAIKISTHSENNNWIVSNNIALQNNGQWISIGGLQSNPTTPSSNPTTQSLALVRTTSIDKKQIGLEFLIINKEQDHYSITQPRLIIRYGQKGVIKLHNNTNTISIDAIATTKA